MRQKGKEKKEKRRIGRQNGEVVTKKREKKRGKGRKEKKRGKEREGGRDKNRKVRKMRFVRYMYTSSTYLPMAPCLDNCFDPRARVVVVTISMAIGMEATMSTTV